MQLVDDADFEENCDCDCHLDDEEVGTLDVDECPECDCYEESPDQHEEPTSKRTIDLPILEAYEQKLNTSKSDPVLPGGIIVDVEKRPNLVSAKPESDLESLIRIIESTSFTEASRFLGFCNTVNQVAKAQGADAMKRAIISRLVRSQK